MSEKINNIRYELSLNDLLTEKLKEAVEAAEALEGGLHNVAKQLDTIGEKKDKADELKKKLGEIGETASKIGEAFGVSFDLSKGLEFVKGAAEEYEKLQLAQSQVEAGLESTQYAAGFTFDELKEGAEESAAKVKFSAEQVTGLQSVLLTYPGVTKQNFSDATTAIEDMSVRTGQDLSATAKQVGQALQDPEKGISSLGVSFSDAQQKIIKNLVATGDIAKAQSIILKQINTDFGGSAAAAAAADPYFKFDKSIEAIQTSIGILIAKIKENLGPVLEKVAGWLAGITGWMTKNKEVVENVASALTPFVGILIGVAGAVQVWTKAQALLNIVIESNPIAKFITIAALLVSAIIYCWTHFAMFRAILLGVWEFLRAFFEWLYIVPIKVMNAFGDMVMGVLTLDGDRITKGFEDAKSIVFDGAKNLAGSFHKGYEEGMADFAKDHTNENHAAVIKISAEDGSATTGKPGSISPPGKNNAAPSAGTETARATGNKSTTINIKINELVKELNLHSTTIQGGAKQIKDIITEVLLSAVNDSQRIAYD